MLRIISAFVAVSLLALPAAAGDGPQTSASAGSTALPDATMPWLTEWLGAVGDANQTILYYGAHPKRLAALSREDIARDLASGGDRLALAALLLHGVFPRAMTAALDFISTRPATAPRPPARPVLAARGATGQTLLAITAALREKAANWTQPASAPVPNRWRLARSIAMARDKADDRAALDAVRAAAATLGAR
jgi:hypothetical protein